VQFLRAAIRIAVDAVIVSERIDGIDRDTDGRSQELHGRSRSRCNA